MIARIASLAGAVLAVVAFAFWHPAPRGTIQSLAVATAQAGATANFGPFAHHKLHRALASVELVVYVAGAVKRPGLYHLKYGDRYDQAIASAGGLAASADAGGVNLAERAADGEEVYVPFVGEIPRTRSREPHRRRRTATPPPDGSVDLNTAGVAELAAVPGVGRAVAARIVEVRERDGSFTSLDELLDVAGMTQTRLERARPYLRSP